MRRGPIGVSIAALLCLTLGTGLWATARPAGQSNAVDPALEQTEDIYIAASNDRPAAIRPVVTSHYGPETAAPAEMLLSWTRIDGAVMYDVQILTEHEENGMPTGTYDQLLPHQRAYTTAFELVLPADFTGNHFYWRVCGLALDGHAVSDYSALEKTSVDLEKPFIKKPHPLSYYNNGKGHVLLYPVYDWVAMPGAASYELEILDEEPENPNGIEPSEHRIDAYYPQYAEQYDAKSRLSDHPFYYRARALDSEGNPIGVYSDAVPFLTDPTVPYAAAIYGDSISHGGGSISYSPTDWEFSYGSYLDFPTVNLSQSGDTSAMTRDRFERDVLPFSPAYLLILMGSNSLRAGVPASDVIADMEAVRQKCLAHGIKPVFLTVPPFNPANIKAAFDEPTVDNWKDQVDAVNEYIRTIVHVDITPGMADTDGELRTELALDGLHLDPPGKKLMAEIINEAWPRIQALPESAWK